LGINSTQRNEKQYHVGSGQLSKNIPTSRTVQIITEELNSLPKRYDDLLNKSRLTDPRLIDKSFFRQCLRRLIYYCLGLAIEEYQSAKVMLDRLDQEYRLYEFDPENGCQLEYPLPLRYGIPCRYWMAYFYQDNISLPLPLFHPRWLINGPSVLYEKWQMRIDNRNYDISGLIEREDRYSGDKFSNRREQVILDTAAELAGYHKQLPPEYVPQFAEAVQLLVQRLQSKATDQAIARSAFPTRLPSPQLPRQPPKFVPSRKRTLTGLEAAEREEVDRSRARRKAEKEVRWRDIAEKAQEQLRSEKAQYNDNIAEDYFAGRYTHSSPFSPLSSLPPNDFPDIDDFLNIDDIPSLPAPAGPSTSALASTSTQTEHRRLPESQAMKAWAAFRASEALRRLERTPSSPSEPTLSQIRTPIEISSSDDDSNDDSDSSDSSDSSQFPTIQELSQRIPPASTAPARPTSTAPPASAPPSTEPLLHKRIRKPTKKQASQNRQKEEKQHKKDASKKKKKKKPKTKDMTQLVDTQIVELPFRSP
jgi:hypothetical protein